MNSKQNTFMIYFHTEDTVRNSQTKWFGMLNRPLGLIGLIPEDIP